MHIRITEDMSFFDKYLFHFTHTGITIKKNLPPFIHINNFHLQILHIGKTWEDSFKNSLDPSFIEVEQSIEQSVIKMPSF